MLIQLNLSIFTKRIATILLALLPLLFSCSGNEGNGTTSVENKKTTETKDAQSNAPADACSLLTEEDAKAVLGNAITKGTSTVSMCQYLSASDKLSQAGESVSIQLNYGAGSNFDTYITDTEKDLKVKTKPVAGVGDKAVFAGGQLIVLQGQNFMTVIVGKKLSEEEQIAAEKTIAQKAIGRLGK
ncbi:MAG: hypothetical protein M3004_05650 [Bacteroidota bacterium]|nr:hypothetical protein [Bacteroidota bacterium]